MAKYRVELEFDVDEQKIGLYMLAYYLERNEYPIINKIFEDYNDDDTPKNFGFVPDEVCCYRITKITEIKDL